MLFFSVWLSSRGFIKCVLTNLMVNIDELIVYSDSLHKLMEVMCVIHTTTTQPSSGFTW